MNSAPERRQKHTCLLRVRESCPFRKLRKSKRGGSCCVIQRCVTRCAASIIPDAAGRPWGCSQASAPHPQALSVRSFSYQHPQQPQQQDHSDMDAEASHSLAGPAISISQGGYTGPAPSASDLMRLQRGSLSASDPSMELDSCVDPETGERALG